MNTVLNEPEDAADAWTTRFTTSSANPAPIINVIARSTAMTPLGDGTSVKLRRAT